MTEKKQLLDIVVSLIDESLANLHTATIAKVTSVNEKTINCKPVISRVVNGEKIQLPEFVDVPPFIMQGGGSYTAYPIAVGDYALLIFTERCYDNWYGGVDNEMPLEYRMHDYSDGFALVGINPLSSAITIPPHIKQVGNTEQIGYYLHDGDRDQQGNFILTGDLTVTGTVTINGNTINNGNLTITGGDLSADGTSFKTHTHGGVESGASNTTEPN